MKQKQNFGYLVFTMDGVCRRFFTYYTDAHNFAIERSRNYGEDVHYLFSSISLGLYTYSKGRETAFAPVSFVGDVL